MKGYFVFHLNLAFSSVDKDSWNTVISKCYWPLLEIASELDVPIGIELSGWTLNGIQETCPEWVEAFKKLLSQKKCELIGSGYCQMISPLVPYEVNIHNQKIGLNIYKKLLGVTPKIALVNEMAFSDSVVDIFAETGYLAFIMDRDNVRLALRMENKSVNDLPESAIGNDENKLPVLWADSILFQKLQQVSHGDISIEDYVNFIKSRLDDGNFLFPLYSNDAETFDFRPGRFDTESEMSASGEWKIIRKVIKILKNELDFEYILPSDAIEISSDAGSRKSMPISSAEYPIPVKKQPKYNIARWAVTGRNDTWLNSVCYKIFNKLNLEYDENSSEWINLCELWASDLRTHITDKRWDECKAKVSKTLNRLNLTDSFDTAQVLYEPIDNNKTRLSEAGIHHKLFGDHIYLFIETPNLKITLNLQRGMAIDSLIFKSHDNEPCIGTIKHGYLPSIDQGADFYSGGTIIESPFSLSKTTDLHPVKPLHHFSKNGDLILKSEIKTDIGQLTKFIKLTASSEEIKIFYKMSNLKRTVSSVRLGNFTLSPQFSRNLKSYSCNVGGSNMRKFDVTNRINHSSPATRFVSSSRGFFATKGQLSLNCVNNNIFFSWDNSQCSPLCFIDHDGDYTRLSFSICEIDESSRESECFRDLEVTLSPKLIKN